MSQLALKTTVNLIHYRKYIYNLLINYRFKFNIVEVVTYK